MANQEKMIRCLACGKNVLKNFNKNNPEAPYAVVPVAIDNVVGCICADCIEHYNSTTVSPDTWEKLFSTVESVNSSASQTSSNSNSSQTKNNSQDSEKSINEDDEYLSELRKKYHSLEYSLDTIASIVKKTVLGQDEAVNKVVYSIYLNQMVNMLSDLDVTFDNLNTGGAPGFKRRHILLIGDTGVGKTLLATTAPKVFGVPYSISNATPLTASGYVGEDIELILDRLYDAAGGKINAAENGIIILDEIDKKRHEPSINSKDVNGKAVQQELLKILEPSTVWIKKHTIPFDTSNLTIIMMGAFVGLDEIIKQRTQKSKIGFSSAQESSEISNEVLPEDLIAYGFIPEFVGRIPSICKFKKLNVETATNIIYNLLEKYNIIFKSKDFELFFSPLLVTKIAEKVVNSTMGARSAETEMDAIIQPALWTVLQSIDGGICEFNDDGSATIIRTLKSNKKDVEILYTPEIKGYEMCEEDY